MTTKKQITMNMKDYLKFVIVGHVDHGKSTLIGRLLFDTNSICESKIEEIKQICESLGRPFEFAYLMDYLEEERQKNITIDTTQTFFKTKKRDYVIIDAPGHKEFLKNMITGSALAEAAILIVDVKEGVQEQTKRHAYVLNLLDIKQLIVVINKMDLVAFKQERFDFIKNELLKHLDSLNLRPNFIIPISARNGDFIAKKTDKLNWYKGPTVLDALDSFKPQIKSANLPLRFPVQDVYLIDGQKILVGRVESGLLEKGKKFILLPSAEKAEIKSIKKWGQELEQAETGHCVGVVLKGEVEVKRGEVICETTNQPKVVNKFSDTIFWMNSQDFKINEPLIFKCVTQESPAKIKKINKLIDSSSLKVIPRRHNLIKETEVAEIELATKDKMVVDDFNFLPELGRFVLIKDNDIVAGGIINL